MSQIRHITILGSGLAAQYFAELFYSHTFIIDQIISRNAEKGKALAGSVKAVWTDDFTQICYSDLVLVCVKDDAIAEVVKDLSLDDGIIAHCSGAVPLTVLSQFERSAVVYPLQTLIEKASGATVPVLLETSFKQDLGTLRQMVEQCGNPCFAVDSEKRKHYHLAAVFANNFGNALMQATHTLTQKFELDFELLKPLISHTLQNVMSGKNPEHLQTGPARRKDTKTMSAHKQMLAEHAELKKLYEAMSEFIVSQYKK